RRTQSGMAAAIVRTRLRTSAGTPGRPGLLRCDNFHQYRLKRLRCQSITVLGRTINNADLHPAQIFVRAIQKSRIPPAQFWPMHVSHVDSQLLTKRDILESDLFLAAENQNEQSQP